MNNIIAKNKVKTMVIALSIAEMWDRFIFYGLLTILLLYTKSAFHFSSEAGYAIWGCYIALGFALPVLGGVIADKVANVLTVMFTGGLSMAMGCLVLCAHGLPAFYLGLALVLVGVGLFKGNVSVFLGMQFERNQQQKETAFNHFFMGMTSGALLGPVIFGFFTAYISWHSIFYFCTGAMLLTQIMLFLVIDNKRAKALFNVLGLTILLCALVYLLFLKPYYGEAIVAIAALVAMGFIALKAYHTDQSYLKRVMGLIILGLITVIFYAATLQVDGSLILLVKHYMLHSVGHFVIPAPAFASIEPLVAFLLAPFLAHFWQWLQKQFGVSMQVWHKIALGLFFTALGFLGLCICIILIKHAVLALSLLIISCVSLGVAAAMVIPASMAAVSIYSPKSIVSTMMGLIFMASSIAGFVASIFVSPNQALHANISLYLRGYIIFAISTLVFGLVCVALSRLFGWLLREPG